MIRHLIEESYELQDAIYGGSIEEVKDELGDVLFQLTFIAFLLEEQRAFDLNDAVQQVGAKMVKRHPHVFGDRKVKTAQEVINLWQADKIAENKKKSESIFNSIPKNLPINFLVYKIVSKLKFFKFGWQSTEEIKIDFETQWDKLWQAISEKDAKIISQQIGKLVFLLLGLSTFLKYHPESTLIQYLEKFKQTIVSIENEMQQKSFDWQSADRHFLTQAWKKFHQRMFM